MKIVLTNKKINIMKKNIFSITAIVMLSIIGLSLHSCSDKGNDAQATNQELIIGKWECIHSYVKEWDYDTTYLNAEGDYDWKYFTYIDESEHGRMGRIDTYSSDGTVSYSTGQEYTYQISGNKLLIAGGLMKYNIDELNNNTLIVSSISNGNFNGVDVTNEYRYTYKRIK